MSTLDETVMFNKQTQSWDTVGHLNKAISAQTVFPLPVGEPRNTLSSLL